MLSILRGYKVYSLNEVWSVWKLTLIFIRNRPATLRLISVWTGTSWNKIVEYGTIPIQMKSKSLQCMHKKWLLVMYVGLDASSANISVKTTLGRLALVQNYIYRLMIINRFWPKLDDMDTDGMWFQQNGATCHTTHATLKGLHERSRGMIISRGVNLNWPPRSSELTPLDFFLWDFLSLRCICEFSVIYAWVSLQIGAIQRSSSEHLSDVVF